MAKKKTNWPLLGAVVGICAAPFTGGASLAMAGKVLIPTLAASAGLGFVGGKVIESALGNDSDNSGIDQTQQNYQAQMEHHKALAEERRLELERLRKREEEKEKQIKLNEEEIKAIKSKIDDPNLSDEEKEKLKKRLIVLEDDNKRLKGELITIKNEIENKEKENIPLPTLPWQFPKFSAYDKLLMTGVLTLIIYYLFLKEDKK